MSVEADLNYIVDNGQEPILYVDWPEEEHNEVPPVFEERKCSITDGREKISEFNISTYGFTFLHSPSRVSNFYDPIEIKNIYQKEVENLISSQTNASEVIVFDHTFRTANKNVAEKNDTRAPVMSVHNDYTENSARQRVIELLPKEKASTCLEGRFGIVQKLRPIRHSVKSEPLAICDGRTIPGDGFVKLQRRYSYRTAETFHISFNPNHHFYYFPEMTPEEVLVFKVFDSDLSQNVRFTAHTAFNDPNTLPNAPKMESVESRALVIF